MELLHTLIAMGAENVSVNALGEALWPDSDGDAAQSAFTVTLHRLRGMIGAESLILGNRRLSLDLKNGQVDSLVLEACLNEATNALGKGQYRQARRLADKALSLASGPFLAGEDENRPIVFKREALAKNLEKVVREVAKALEKAGVAGADSLEAGLARLKG